MHYRKMIYWWVAVLTVIGTQMGRAQTAAVASSAPLDPIVIAESQGVVEVQASGSTTWTLGQPNQLLHPADHIRTGPNSRVALRWSNKSVISFGASTELEILAPTGNDNQAGVNLVHGVISFFHRDEPGRIHVNTRGAIAGVEGTEFLLAADDADRTTVSVVDGRVKFGTATSTLTLTNGEQAVVDAGQAPKKTAGFIANNLLQWCFYYPGVINPADLELTSAEQQALAGSLSAYRSGDLLAALAQYPAGRTGVSDRETIYHAALLLAVGEVTSAQNQLGQLSSRAGRTGQLAGALDVVVAAVKHQPATTSAKAELASELLAASYFEQSRAIRETSLRAALALARQATVAAPDFGFAWERVAELEFSCGEAAAALKDLEKSLALAPRNAQALALKGFILAAKDQPKQAVAQFDQAIAVDGALGNAWLGRGLSKLRLGDKAGGRQDLLLAAALEPQRAELRSYLGKAYAWTGDMEHATKELDLAKKLDPQDPTAYLYSALVKQENNEVNDAIRDLEKSQKLNDNRSVYRSQLLLDQDAAVRSADLAGIYRDAGMLDWSLREAGRAVSYDYANYSAHLFLANSYDQLRDPTWSNLRYETPANSEYFIANLLAPASAGWLSSVTAGQPNTRLFDQNRVGVVSDTTYLDRGAWYQQGATFGVYDDFSYNVEAKYTTDPGQFLGNNREERDLVASLKYQLTPHDSLSLSVEQLDEVSGSTSLYYQPPKKISGYLQAGSQNPNVFLGYHHDWSPGVQTLFQATYLNGSALTVAPYALQLVPGTFDGPGDPIVALFQSDAPTNFYRIAEDQYILELQQIFQSADHTTILGAKYSFGDYTYITRQSIAPDFIFGDTNIDLQYKDYFHHASIYGYHDWQILDSLKATIGLDFDYLEQPQVANTHPYSPDEIRNSQLSPKAGLIWNPFDHTTVRLAYTRSMSGLANESAIRLEPTEVAGFNQAYRNIAPNSVIGDTSGSQLDTIDLSIEQKFDTGTYIAIWGEVLYSKMLKNNGVFIYSADTGEPFPSYLRQRIDYREWSASAAIDQLLGKQWSVGAKYSLNRANLETSYIDINPDDLIENEAPSYQIRQAESSLLHRLNLHANWNHPWGWFSSFEANWYKQSNVGFSSVLPGDDFWQFNAYAGYRFWHRRAELTVGLLNIGDQNYRLEPLSFYNEPARGRTFMTRLKVNF